MKFLIKCRVKNDLCFYKFKFKIFDLDNNLIIDSETDKYGCYTCILPQKLYIIKIYSDFCPNVMVGIINKEINHFYFVKMSSITITLLDQNYIGLPIKKGEIKLWPNHTT